MSGSRSKSGFVSFINTHTHTQTHTPDSSVMKGVQMNAQEGVRDRENEHRRKRQKSKRDKDNESVKLYSKR